MQQRMQTIAGQQNCERFREPCSRLRVSKPRQVLCLIFCLHCNDSEALYKSNNLVMENEKYNSTASKGPIHNVWMIDDESQIAPISLDSRIDENPRRRSSRGPPQLRSSQMSKQGRRTTFADDNVLLRTRKILLEKQVQWSQKTWLIKNQWMTVKQRTLRGTVNCRLLAMKRADTCYERGLSTGTFNNFCTELLNLMPFRFAGYSSQCRDRAAGYVAQLISYLQMQKEQQLSVSSQSLSSCGARMVQLEEPSCPCDIFILCPPWQRWQLPLQSVLRRFRSQNRRIKASYCRVFQARFDTNFMETKS